MKSTDNCKKGANPAEQSAGKVMPTARTTAFRRVIQIFSLNQTALCRRTEENGAKVYPTQLSTWLSGSRDLHGAAVDALERSLPESARAVYYGILVSGMDDKSKEINLSAQ